MKRILHIIGGLNRGGAETWLIQVLRNIDRTQFQFDFLVHTEGPFHYQAEVGALGSKVLVCRGYKNPLIYSATLLGILRDHGPYDCLHSHVHHFSGIPLLIARMAGVPVRIVQSHTGEIERNTSPARQVYTRLMKRLTWSCATEGLAVSAKAADALFPLDWKNHLRWKTIPLGVELAPFRTAVNREMVRRGLAIPMDAMVVGHVGRFVDVKNHAFLLEIAAETVRIMPKAQFLLVGDGPLRSAIENKVKTMNLLTNVIFTGIREDVPLLMQGAMDVFLLPSLYEGLPMVLLEAQAAGLPCLISDQISSEADAVIDLVSREALTTSPRRWAERLLSLRNSRLSPSLAALADPSSIDSSVQRVVQSYL